MSRASRVTAHRIAEKWPAKFKTLNAFRKALNSGWATTSHMVKHDLPPNHPLLARVADMLEIPLPELIDGNTTPPLTEGRLAMVTKGMNYAGKTRPRKNGKVKLSKSKALVHVPRSQTTHAMSKTALRKLDPKALQLARTLVTSLNIEIMRGKAYISLPNVPTDALALLLTDYLSAKGVPGVMILNPDYAEMFA